MINFFETTPRRLSDGSCSPKELTLPPPGLPSLLDHMAAFSRAVLSRLLILYTALYAGFGVQSSYLPMLLHSRGQPAGVQVRSRCAKHGGGATSGTPARSDQSTMALVNSSFEGAPGLELSVPA
jgi:hypothetical protein